MYDVKTTARTPRAPLTIIYTPPLDIPAIYRMLCRCITFFTSAVMCVILHKGVGEAIGDVETGITLRWFCEKKSSKCVYQSDLRTHTLPL